MIPDVDPRFSARGKEGSYAGKLMWYLIWINGWKGNINDDGELV